MNYRTTVLAGSLLAVALLPLSVARAVVPGDPAYLYVDRVEGEYVSYNAVPRRPMAFTEEHLWAVNTHASTVVRFDLPIAYSIGLTEPDATHHVPKSPVSIALWNDPNDAKNGDRLVVVCDGTYGVAMLDRASGAVLDLIELRLAGPPDTALAEPGDLLVDDTEDRAFISCAAADSVVEIDLCTAQIVRVFKLPAKDPVFMCFDAEGDVLVAPQFSGNNSGPHPHPVPASASHQGPKVLDFALDAENSTSLPDQDLFRCVRSSGAVEPVMTGMGTVLFACGINPDTGKIWQLCTEANNKNAAKQTEASIQGDIVENRLAIGTLPGSGTNPASKTVDLDRDLLAITNPDPDYSVGQPYGLGFNDSSGEAYVTALLTDNVTVLDSDGDYVDQIDVPRGSTPRAALHHAEEEKIFVYCWGTSKIEVHLAAPPYGHHAQLDLGYDPTPESIQVGRAVFYDGSLSQYNNASCASCHVEGRTDMVLWNLSKAELDDKGPMVTQTLAGIERLVPFHWRGEQQQNLLDFKPAFTKLLGAAAEPTSEQFEAFQDFVFSIQNRPNPFQHPERILDSASQPAMPDEWPAGDPTSGQLEYVAQCESCHSFPMGTNNDVVNPGTTTRQEKKPRRMFTKNTPFNDIYKKEQDADPATVGNQTISIDLESLTMITVPPTIETYSYPLLGVGLSHAGLFDNLHDFVDVVFPTLTDQEVADITTFVHQWDQGLAPAVARGVMLDQAHYTSATPFVGSYLIDQADLRNCDVVAFGTSQISSVDRYVRWWYNRSTGEFVPDDVALSDQPFSFFDGQAFAGTGSNVFLGVPVGSGRRFAIDFDGDELRNQNEAAHGCSETNPDADGDGDPDGHEVRYASDPTDNMEQANDIHDPTIVRAVTDMVTGKVARINIETSEPCTLAITYSTSGGSTLSKITKDYARTHSVLLNDLRLSTNDGSSFTFRTFDGDITAEDWAVRTVTQTGLPNMPSFNFGLTTSPDPAVPGPITTRFYNDNPTDASVLENLAWVGTPAINGAGTFSAIAKVDVRRKIGGVQAGKRVIARIFVGGTLASTYTAGGTSLVWTSFQYPVALGLATFSGLNGPFLVSGVSDSGGEARFRFSVPGVGSQAVLLNMELVVADPTTSGVVDTITGWNMPTTAAENRALEYP